MSAGRVLVVVGTRPEAIKMAPVVRALRARAEGLEVQLCAVAQQAELLDDALAEQELVPDVRVDPPHARGGLAQGLASLLPGLERVVRERGPDVTLVHGDTTTALAGALASFYAGYPVGHVEAGLRTGDPTQPFPEETHRVLVGRLATFHYAPTPRAREALLREGVLDDRVVVVGNPVLDALAHARAHAVPAPVPPGRRRILATGHRRESFGGGIEGVCEALGELVREREDVELVYVLHPHPEAHGAARRILEGLPRVRLTSPVRHRELAGLLESAWVVVTDSGGLQEEAPSCGKPCLVTRAVTERPEAVEAGVARVVGPRAERLREALRELLDDADAHRRMARVCHPFGHGGAAARIAEDLARRCLRLRCA